MHNRNAASRPYEDSPKKFFHRIKNHFMRLLQTAEKRIGIAIRHNSVLFFSRDKVKKLLLAKDYSLFVNKQIEMSRSGYLAGHICPMRILLCRPFTVLPLLVEMPRLSGIPPKDQLRAACNLLRISDSANWRSVHSLCTLPWMRPVYEMLQGGRFPDPDGKILAALNRIEKKGLQVGDVLGDFHSSNIMQDRSGAFFLIDQIPAEKFRGFDALAYIAFGCCKFWYDSLFVFMTDPKIRDRYLPLVSIQFEDCLSCQEGILLWILLRFAFEQKIGKDTRLHMDKVCSLVKICTEAIALADAKQKRPSGMLPQSRPE